MTKTYLFIHPHFPGQFAHVAAALVAQGHQVVALAITGLDVPGVRMVRYHAATLPRPSDVDMARDVEAKVLRGAVSVQAMEKLRQEGFSPHVVVAHPGWGDALFCKDVWPAARLVIYAEFFYSSQGADYGFDKEFFDETTVLRAWVRLKNSAMLHALSAADVVYAPTQWQRSLLPVEYRVKTRVAFEGIDTTVARPDPAARVPLRRGLAELTAPDEVITFASRNLEPYRGFHVFMRALPDILARRPNAHCIVVGGDACSYGPPPREGGTWREVLMREVGNRLPVDRVHFLGALPYQEYLRVLQISACHVYLTYPFVLSWSCLEAMSVGCSLVASRTGPVQEVVTDGDNGLLVDFFDRAALANRVVAVLDDRQMAERLGSSARRLMKERFDLRSVCLPAQLDILA